MNTNIVAHDDITMSSFDIAILTGARNSEVVSVAKTLSNKNVIDFSMSHLDVMQLDKRNSLVLVANLSPEFTAAIVDRWQELESNQAPQIPQSYAAALIEAGRLAQITQDQAEQLAIAAPKVEYHDKVLASDNGLLTTEIAAEFNMSAIALNRLLQDLKVQRKVGGRWVLTAAMLGKGLTTEGTFIDENGKSRHSLKWTEAGRKLIHELMEGVSDV
tara:strand:- start:1219 stop:1866 length:648 start_codon:yes stop_codon:yes gene_type:complete